MKDIALKTIELEAKAVQGLAQRLTADFEAVVQSILHCKGRVIVAGIGKSAIIAQKIVATFNSTGTPSLFLHAAEAVHGDLGMVLSDDIVILISKSGESPEIKSLVTIIKAMGNTMVAIVGNLHSTLAKAADFVLDTTVEQEACPNNLAPTSSTTAQLVMGDALAVALMHQRAFKAEDFAKFHPGGNLGKRLLLRVGDLITNSQKPSVNLKADIKSVILSISGGRCGATVVLDDVNKICGIITDGDLRRMMEKSLNLQALTAKDICSPQPKTVSPEVMAVAALDVMKENDISQLVVASVDGGYLGLLHLHQLVQEGLV